LVTHKNCDCLFRGAGDRFIIFLFSELGGFVHQKQWKKVLDGQTLSEI